jgi:carbonic anhydrase/acetyltransferase-like protein (isoleucine patch superfamily)
MPIYQLGQHRPKIDSTAYITDSATLIGKVTIGKNASVWFGATLRGDNEMITIGDGSNVQESAVMHTDPGFPLTVGQNVTIGHQAMLHGCTIGDGSLIGIAAIVLNNATIGKNCRVGAGALVLEGKSFPDNSLIVGSPARVARSLSEEEIAGLQKAAAVYVARGQEFTTQLTRIG